MLLVRRVIGDRERRTRIAERERDVAAREAPTSVFPSPPTLMPDSPESPPRRWRDKFHEALRGLKFGVRGQSSFFVHFFFAALVIAAALVLYYTGSTINTMVIAGLVIALGEVVEDAIIDVENIFRRLRGANSFMAACPPLDSAAAPRETTVLAR